MLPTDAGRVLLPLARAALAERLGLSPPAVPEADWLAVPGASFVSVHIAGRLRGCIGTLEQFRSLGADVVANARAAAFEDPRFRPLAVSEYLQVALEVSVVSVPEPIAYADEADLRARLRPGVDGLLLEAGRKRGTFLPQVWAQLPERAEFLNNLKAKAGLPRDAWSPAWRFLRYTVSSWAEDPEVGRPSHPGSTESWLE
jgi:uncharacterized protein